MTVTAMYLAAVLMIGALATFVWRPLRSIGTVDIVCMLTIALLLLALVPLISEIRS